MQSATLKKKLKVLSEVDETFRIRMHRAISWLTCAEKQSSDIDLRYLTLWIALNSCYAIDSTESNQKSEREKFRKFIVSLITNDNESRISKLLWEKFSGPIQLLIKNQYAFKPFWDYQRGEIKDWKNFHQSSIQDSMDYLSKNNTSGLLDIILDRLYVLRNQLIHGGATYKSEINRTQLKDGTRILEMLIPIIIDIMLQNPNEDWGRILYPVIK